VLDFGDIDLLRAAIAAAVEAGAENYVDLSAALNAVGFVTRDGKPITPQTVRAKVVRHKIPFATRGAGHWLDFEEADREIAKLWRRQVRKPSDVARRLNKRVAHPEGCAWNYQHVRRRQVVMGLARCPTCNHQPGTRESGRLILRDENRFSRLRSAAE